MHHQEADPASLPSWPALPVVCAQLPVASCKLQLQGRMYEVSFIWP